MHAMPEVSYPVPSGSLRAHLAVPEAAGPWPGVVVVHELYGLNDDIRRIAERLAGSGYLALAPDLYAWGHTARCMVQTMRSLVRRDGRAFEDIEAARAWLAARDDCTGAVGIVGFCMGGGFAILCAPRYEFAAAAPFYGEVPKDAADLLRGACPIVASYGARDWMMRGRAERLERALDALGIPHDVKVYPNATHSFMSHHDGPVLRVADAVFRIRYDESSAEDAWGRTLAFFGEHLSPTEPGLPSRD